MSKVFSVWAVTYTHGLYDVFTEPQLVGVFDNKNKAEQAIQVKLIKLGVPIHNACGDLNYCICPVDENCHYVDAKNDLNSFKKYLAFHVKEAEMNETYPIRIDI